MLEMVLDDQLTSDRHLQDLNNLAHLNLSAVSSSLQNPTPNRPRHRNNKNGQKSAAAAHALKLDSMSIEDAIKNEIEFMPLKTPISILQELLSRRGITPNYELVQIEGAVHEPTFRYRVSFNDKDGKLSKILNILVKVSTTVNIIAMGVGRSKKEAKHAAAKALIDKLTGLNLSEQHYQAAQLPPKTSTVVTGAVNGTISLEGFDEKNLGNPIGVLQEQCMTRHWPPPVYETEMEVGLPHERQFTIACIVLKYREEGMGKSKKIAKRQAAYKMWQKLLENPLEQTDIIQALDEEGNEEVSL